MSNIRKLTVPDLGEDVHSVQITEWFCDPGDRVSEDEDIVEISSDKAVFSISTPYAGILEKQCCKNGDEVAPGEVIARIQV